MKNNKLFLLGLSALLLVSCGSGTPIDVETAAQRATNIKAKLDNNEVESPTAYSVTSSVEATSTDDKAENFSVFTQVVIDFENKYLFVTMEMDEGENESVNSSWIYAENEKLILATQEDDNKYYVEQSSLLFDSVVSGTLESLEDIDPIESSKLIVNELLSIYDSYKAYEEQKASNSEETEETESYKISNTSKGEGHLALKFSVKETVENVETNVAMKIEIDNYLLASSTVEMEMIDNSSDKPVSTKMVTETNYKYSASIKKPNLKDFTKAGF